MKKISLAAKVFVILMLGLMLYGIVGVVEVARVLRTTSTSFITDSARNLISTFEATRTIMSDRIQSGVIPDLEVLAETVSDDVLIKAVPIIAAIDVAQEGLSDENISFRVPKVNPRNPENTPTELEGEVLETIKADNLSEYIYSTRDEIRIFRPIRLTQDCLICHGSPTGSPDPIGGIKEGWKVGEIHGAFEIIYDLSAVNARLAAEQFRSMLFSLAAIAVIGVILVIFLRRSLMPISTIVSNMEKVAAGDLTIEFQSRSRDEIGDLSTSMTNFVAQQNSQFRELRSISSEVDMSAKEVSDGTMMVSNSLKTMQETSAAIDERFASFDDDFQRTNHSVEQVRQFITGVTELINRQVDAVHQSSSAVEEISANITEIARQADNKQQVAQELERIAISGEEGIGRLTGIILKITESADRIQKMIYAISEIAERTNLLAMNAAIEAAHAGESGRGFAVVANEIRDLAINSAKSTTEITAALKDISSLIYQSKEAGTTAEESFENVLERIRQVVMSMRELKAGTDEISLGSHQILDSLQTLTGNSEEMKSSAGSMNDQMGNISGTLGELSSQSTHMRSRFESLESNMLEINAYLTQFTQSGEKNREHAGRIDDFVSGYILDKDKPQNQ